MDGSKGQEQSKAKQRILHKMIGWGNYLLIPTGSSYLASETEGWTDVLHGPNISRPQSRRVLRN